MRRQIQIDIYMMFHFSKIEADKMFKTIEGLYRVNGNMEMIATLK